MANNSVKYDISKLDDLIKSLNDDYTLRVGVIGSEARKKHGDSKSKSDVTNAEVGTFHEFGTSKMARRSFLEDSLKFKFNFNTEEMKSLRKLFFNQFFIKNSPKVFLEAMGAKCLEIIDEAFNTNGWGMWQPLSLPLFAKRFEQGMKSYNKLFKKMTSGKVPYSKQKLESSLNDALHPHILTDTGELRDSISFKIFKNGK